MLTQLHAFFLASNNVPVVLIYNKGTRYDLDIAGAITRGPALSPWLGDGEYPTKWARFFLIFQLTGSTLAVPLLSESGEEILTESGEVILVDVDISSLTAAEEALICSVPREWNAAHVDRIYIILLPPDAFVFGFPPVQFGDPGITFGGGGAVTFSCI